jgi:hypothetical protein
MMQEPTLVNDVKRHCCLYAKYDQNLLDCLSSGHFKMDIDMERVVGFTGTRFQTFATNLSTALDATLTKIPADRIHALLSVANSIRGKCQNSHEWKFLRLFEPGSGKRVVSFLISMRFCRHCGWIHGKFKFVLSQISSDNANGIFQERFCPMESERGELLSRQ